MRVFIAVELQKNIKQYIAKKQDLVKEWSLKGNYSRVENFHLTLRFIGEINDDELERLKATINDIAGEFEPFNFTLGELGFFPSRNRKIVWIGIKQGERDLKLLFTKLETTLEKNGFPREPRGFKPHITIGREVRLKVDMEELISMINIDNIIVPVEKISLMESVKINDKLTYRPVYIKEFGNNIHNLHKFNTNKT